MKKIVLGTLIASSLCGSLPVFAATNGEGQINFTGEILDSACEVVNSLSNPLNVDLGKVSKTAFSGIGSTADTTEFAIQLKNCPETVSTAAITFGGTPDADNSNVLALTAGTGVAAGVGIQLLDSAKQPLNLYTASQPYTLQSGTTDNNLQFAARYIQTQSAINAGPANAVSTFTVVYN